MFKRVHRGLRDLYDINAKMYEILQTYNKITTVHKTKNFGDTTEIIYSSGSQSMFLGVLQFSAGTPRLLVGRMKNRGQAGVIRHLRILGENSLKKNCITKKICF